MVEIAGYRISVRWRNVKDTLFIISLFSMISIIPVGVGKAADIFSILQVNHGSHLPIIIQYWIMGITTVITIGMSIFFGIEILKCVLIIEKIGE